MLLTIDKVLELLVDGKTVEKIAELADVTSEDVLGIIAKARDLLLKYEKPAARRKIIIKKKQTDQGNDNELTELLAGADLTAVQMNSHLTVFAAGEIVPETKEAGIGLVILDNGGNQVGKVSMYIGKAEKPAAVCTAVIKAIKIAAYFSTAKLSLRINSENVKKYIAGENTTDSKKLAAQKEEIISLMKKIPACTIDAVPDVQNDKAIFFARQSIGLVS